MDLIETRAIEAEIELHIRSGRTKDVRRLTLCLLKISKRSAEARLKASDYLRRISRYAEALKILQNKIVVEYNPQLSALNLQIHIQTLRLLNLVGASGFALTAANQYPKEIQKKFSAAFSEIYLSNYYYEKAYELLHHRQNQNIKILTYSERLSLVSVCDCLNGLEKYQHAIKLIHQLIKNSPELILQGILHQVLATSLIGIGQTKKALIHLALAERVFKNDPSTFDAAYVNKWFGIAYLKLLDFDRAQSYFDRAWEVLYRPGHKPEAWLELLFYMGLLHYKKTKKIAAEWKRLLAYPGPHRRFIDQILKEVEPHAEFYFSLESITQQKHFPYIDLANDTSIQKTANKEKYDLGLNVTEQAHYFLLVAGDYGIPYYRFFDVLWSHETFSCIQFQKRFEQILSRLRKLNVIVETKKHHLTLKKSSAYAFWINNAHARGKPFLDHHKDFTRKDIELFFDISARSAVSLCQHWLATGSVIKTEAGYQSCIE